MFKAKLKKYELYFGNFSWFLIEKLVRVGVGVAASVLLARYLGASGYGNYSFIASLLSLALVFSHVGVEGLLIKRIVIAKDEEPNLLGSAWLLKAFGSVVGASFYLLYVFEFTNLDEVVLASALFGSLAFVAQPFLVFESWAKAHTVYRYVAISAVLSVVVSFFLKFSFVLSKATFFYFVITIVAQWAVFAVGLSLFYTRYKQVSNNALGIRLSIMVQFLKKGWPLYIGAFFAVANLKIDQIMIMEFMDARAVGIYSVASQISEMFYFLPVAIVSTLYPRLISKHQEDAMSYKAAMQKVYDLLFVLGLGLGFFLWLFSEVLVGIAFGDQYSDSAHVLKVHAWACVFIFMRGLFSRAIIIEDMIIYSLLTQGLGAIINVLLNLFLIKTHGEIGAAYATVASYSASSYFSLLLWKRTRSSFLLMTSSFFLPFRLMRRVIFIK